VTAGVALACGTDPGAKPEGIGGGANESGLAGSAGAQASGGAGATGLAGGGSAAGAGGTQGPAGSGGDDSGGAGGEPLSMQVTLHNWSPNGLQVVMQDARGSAVDAHDGDVHFFDGLFYLYGTSYDCGWAWNGGSAWCGVKVYSSPDLRHWSDGKLAFPLTANWTSGARCGGGNGCFRPHVVFNPSTGQYVMWLNRGPGGADDTNASYYTLTSETPDGPFEETASTPTLCKRSGNGDVALFVDGTTAYAIYTAFGSASTDCAAAQRSGIANRIALEKLDATFTTSADPSHAGCPADPCASNDNLFAWLTPQSDYENGYILKRGDAYYAVYQDTCPYCNDQLTDPSDGIENVYYRVATGSPFALASAPPHDISASPRAGRPASDRACTGQFSFIAQVPDGAGDESFVYVSDSWDDAVKGLKGSQAQANVMWEKLAFDADGSIQPLTCADRAELTVPYADVPPRAAAALTTAGTPQNDFCDIRGGVRRAQVFTLPAAGALSEVATVVYRSNGLSNPSSFGQVDGNADGPLVLELFATQAGLPSGPALASLSVPAEQVSFGRRRVALQPNLAVTQGASYALVLSSPDSTTGAYGWLYSDEKPLGTAATELFGTDGGWTVEPKRDLYLEVTLD
jgi:hypothetical protein